MSLFTSISPKVKSSNSSDFRKEKIKEKKQSIKNQKTWEELRAIFFIEKHFPEMIEQFSKDTGLCEKSSVEMLTEALINKYDPNLEEEMFDLVNGGSW